MSRRWASKEKAAIRLSIDLERVGDEDDRTVLLRLIERVNDYPALALAAPMLIESYEKYLTEVLGD